MHLRWQLFVVAGLLAGCKTAGAPPSTTPASASAEPAQADDEEPLAQAADDARRHEAALAENQKFLADHANDPEQAAAVMVATLRIGKSQAALGRHDEAKASYRDVVSRFESAGFSNATEEADSPAEATFLLAEYDLAEVMNQRLVGNGTSLEESTKALFDSLVEAAASYDAVFPYRRLEWVLAAMVRRGQAFEDVAAKLRAHPPPAELTEPNALQAYQKLVEDFAVKLDSKAIQLYSAAVARGKEFSIDNEWTQSAAVHLAKLQAPGNEDQS